MNYKIKTFNESIEYKISIILSLELKEIQYSIHRVKLPDTTQWK